MITYGRKSRKKSMVFKPDSRDHKTKQSFQTVPRAGRVYLRFTSRDRR